MHSRAQIIDTHLHLDSNAGPSLDGALAELSRQMSAAGIEKAVILHLLPQPWSAESLIAAINKDRRLRAFVNVNPKAPTAIDDFDKALKLGFIGLKLHPRIHGFSPDDPDCVVLVRKAGDAGVPVLIDAFPDGDWLMAGLSALRYGALAKAAPETKVIVAHSAGHQCLDLLMLMKRMPNLWLDISFSLLYYRGPVVENLLYMLQSLRCERCLFGTDYPDRPLPESVSGMLDILESSPLSEEQLEKLLWKNARILFPHWD